MDQMLKDILEQEGIKVFTFRPHEIYTQVYILKTDKPLTEEKFTSFYRRCRALASYCVYDGLLNDLAAPTNKITKEFTTYWTQHYTKERPDDLTLSQRNFFTSQSAFTGRVSSMIVPDDIKFADLTVFLGRKTKVTIEIIE